MKLEEIQAIWREDSRINKDRLDEESILGPNLHSKYFDIFLDERMVLKRLKQELKRLGLEKYHFYTQGASKEQIQKGWAVPAKGKIMKSDVGRYLEADSDLQNLELRIEHQESKIDFLYSIVDTISKRGFAIKNAIDFIRWQGGY